jgi:O-antigen/teichoic acid export membrane protein
MYDLFLGNTAYTLLLAVTAIVVGRIIGPDGYGLYAVALIVPSFLFTAVRLGLDSAATRYAARLRSEGKEQEAVSFIYATMIFGVVIATASSLVFVGLSGWIATDVVERPELGPFIIPVGMLSVIGQAAFNVTDLGMTGLGKFDRAGLVQALQGAIKLVVSIALVGVGLGVTGAVAGYTTSFVVSGGLGVAYIIWLARGKLPKGMKVDFETAVRYGFPIYLSSLVGGLVAPVISITLARAVSNSQIGGYSQASAFISLIALLTYPISTALFPLFSRKVDDLRSLGEPYQTSLRYTALLVTPVTGFIIAFSGPLMETVYGRAYAFASPFLGLFAVSSLLAGLGSLAWGPLLNGIGRTRDVLLTTALGSVVSMAIGVGLIEAFGVPGAIVGPIIGVVVSLSVGTWLVNLRLGTRLDLSRVWKFYAASGLAAGLTWPISWFVYTPELALVGGAVAFVVLFVPFLALFSALSEADVNELRGFLGFSALISRPLEAAISYYRACLGTFHPKKMGQGN